MNILTTVYLGNGLGIALDIVMLCVNAAKKSRDKDFKNINRCLILALISCIVDPIVYTVDGKPGILNTIIIYAGNSWLFFANVLMGLFWVTFFSEHIGVKLSKVRKTVYTIASAFSAACIITNFFVPIIFAVENNVYRRTYLFWMFVVLCGLLIIDSIVLYFKARKKEGISSFFPLMVFLVPVAIGVAIQSAFYGISIVWTSIVIALAGVTAAIQNEVIYSDLLTGLYNRFYLQQLQADIGSKNKTYMTGIMADLNDFKSINDNFGHTTGDDALIQASQLFLNSVGEHGIVTRYAGDEFVLFLNTINETEINETMNAIHKAFSDFNENSNRPYKLSVSMGYCICDLKNMSVNEFMNVLDQRMYKSKEEFYLTHEKQR